MNLKRISFDDEAKEGLRKGITTLAKAVKSTLGPRGRTVIIEAEDVIMGRTVTKDGATVAKYINSADSIEDMAITIMRDAATKTAKDAGDGTTTSIVITEALINQFDFVMENDDYNPNEVINQMKFVLEDIIKEIDAVSIDIDDEKLLQIATISSNNDAELGTLISDAYKAVGKDGVVLVENSKDSTTSFEHVEGITFDRGLTSTYQINNRSNNTVDMESVRILITDKEIEDLRQIENILAPVVQSRLNLLIIGEMTLRAQAALNKNVHEGKLKAAFVLPPNFGYRKTQILEDIAFATGGVYISEQTGDDWELVTLDKLGSADRIVIDQKSTVIIDNSEINSLSRQARIDELKVQLSKATDDGTKEDLEHRIAVLCGNVAKIKVGGNTSDDMKEKRDRVDDAVLASKAALEEGILPGGGVTLYAIGSQMVSVGENINRYAAEVIVRDAIMAPLSQIITNSGMDVNDVVDSDEFDAGNNIGYDLKAGVYGNMIDMGIIDPTKVTKTALRNAVAVASTILGSPVVITNARKDD